MLSELSESFGPVCGMGLGPLRIVVVGAPRLIRELLMQSNHRFRADTPLGPFPFIVGKHTMIASDGADHHRRRGAVQQAFGRRRLNRWIPMIAERTDALRLAGLYASRHGPWSISVCRRSNRRADWSDAAM